MNAATFYNTDGKILVSIRGTNDMIQQTIESFTEKGHFWIEGYYKSDKHYIVEGEVFDIPNRPSMFHYFNYDTKKWDILTDGYLKVRSVYKNHVNSEAAFYINAKYPEYKQRNILASGDSLLISQCWGYINSVRDLSNIANDKIDLEYTEENINKLFLQFKKDVQLL